MNNLSQEIVDSIALFLPGGSSAEWSVQVKNHTVSPYAVISNKFRVAIERGTFKRLRVNNEELEAFVQVLTPSRRGFLRFLSYIIVLPPVDAALSQRYEGPTETEAVSKVFSLYMRNFFDMLN